MTQPKLLYTTEPAETGDSPLILLIGGAGYIGTHLMLELHGKQLAHGPEGCRYQVVIVDKDLPNADALRYIEDKTGMKVIYHQVDLTEAVYPPLPRRPYCAIMLAALKDVNEGQKIPYEYIRTNITLCTNSMEYVNLLGIRRLIQSSSSSIYHQNHKYEPVGVYGYTKGLSEKICERLMTPQQQLLVLRYMNPIGSHPDLNLFAKIGVCKKLAELAKDEIFVNRGDCIRDYIHITDLAAFHSLALEAWHDTIFTTEGSRIVTLDVGTGCATSTTDLVKIFGEGKIKMLQHSRQEHEGYDTSMTDLSKDEVNRHLPSWLDYPKISLAIAVRDYIRSTDSQVD